MSAPGLSASDVDRLIAAPLGALARDRLEVEVVSTAGRARAVFEDSAAQTDAQALDRVRGLLQEVRFPRGAEAPVIASVPPMRAMRWALFGGDTGQRQRRLAARIEAMSGVRHVRSCGVPSAEIHVVVDPDRAAARGVQPMRITEVLRREARDIPDIAELPVAEGVRVRDIATVAQGRAAEGCRCVSNEGPCATGVATVESEDAFLEVQRALLTTEEPGVEVLEPDVVRVQLDTVAGTRLEHRERLARAVLDRAREIHRLGHPLIEIGPPETHDAPGAHLTFHATLARDPADAVSLVHQAIGEVPGLALAGASGRGPTATLFVEGDDAEVRAEIATPLARALRSTQGIRAVFLDDLVETPSLRLDVDARRAGTLGVAPPSIAAAILLATRGDVAAMLVRDGESIPIRVLLRGGPVETHELDLDRLRGLTVPMATGAVPLSELVSLSRSSVPESIRRCGARGCTRLTLEAEAGAVDALARAQDAVRDHEVPAGYTLRWVADPPLFPQ